MVDVPTSTSPGELSVTSVELGSLEAAVEVRKKSCFEQSWLVLKSVLKQFPKKY
jgi:hypothetical protein